MFSLPPGHTNKCSTAWCAANTNLFTLLVDNDDDCEKDETIPPTATAYPVLDHNTGITLEHRQLGPHPKYKPSTPDHKRVAGTRTLRPIKINNIQQLMWLSGRPMLYVAKVGGLVPAKCQR